MTSGKIQIPAHTAIKFFSDFPGKFRKLFRIVCIWTTGGKLPEDGVFGNSGNRRHANKSASFKGPSHSF